MVKNIGHGAFSIDWWSVLVRHDVCKYTGYYESSKSKWGTAEKDWTFSISRRSMLILSNSNTVSLFCKVLHSPGG
jgi:hypothetical protein